MADEVSQKFSGLALWPRLVLNPKGTLVVESRGPKGEHHKSHWQTVLPLMSARPSNVGPFDKIRVEYTVDLRDGKPDTPLVYTLDGIILQAAST